jgi:hypothetical protein
VVGGGGDGKDGRSEDSGAGLHASDAEGASDSEHGGGEARELKRAWESQRALPGGAEVLFAPSGRVLQANAGVKGASDGFRDEKEEVEGEELEGGRLRWKGSAGVQ